MRRPIEERSDARDRGHERDYECGRCGRERGHWGEYGVKPLTQNKNATLRRPSRSAPSSRARDRGLDTSNMLSMFAPTCFLRCVDTANKMRETLNEGAALSDNADAVL